MTANPDKNDTFELNLSLVLALISFYKRTNYKVKFLLIV